MDVSSPACRYDRSNLAPLPPSGTAGWLAMKFAMLVWRNLRRSPRRTILTVLAIALAAFTYSSLSSLPNVARRMLNTPDSARRIVVMTDSGFFNRLPDS